MSDPILTQVAVAVASETAKALVASGRSAVAALAAALRRKLAARPAEARIVAALEAAPEDKELAAEVLLILRDMAGQDARFAEQFDAAVEEQRVTIHADHGGTVNYVGSAGKVLQIHDNHGPISL